MASLCLCLDSIFEFLALSQPWRGWEFAPRNSSAIAMLFGLFPARVDRRTLAYLPWTSLPRSSW